MWTTTAVAADVGPEDIPYEERVASLAAARGTVASGGEREELFRAITTLIPRWTGTPWSFYGDAEAPGVEPIACGYFVSVILRDAGFKVERRRLAQQAAEHIIQTFVDERHIKRYRNQSAHAVVADVAKADGVYLVGLDVHVGFLITRGGRVEFCHSSYVDHQGPMCEDPLTSPAFVSRYRVTGELLVDPVVEGWRDGRVWSTVTGASR